MVSVHIDMNSYIKIVLVQMTGGSYITKSTFEAACL